MISPQHTISITADWPSHAIQCKPTRHEYERGWRLGRRLVTAAWRTGPPVSRHLGRYFPIKAFWRLRAGSVSAGKQQPHESEEGARDVGSSCAATPWSRRTECVRLRCRGAHLRPPAEMQAGRSRCTLSSPCTQSPLSCICAQSLDQHSTATRALYHEPAPKASPWRSLERSLQSSEDRVDIQSFQRAVQRRAEQSGVQSCSPFRAVAMFGDGKCPDCRAAARRWLMLQLGLPLPPPPAAATAATAPLLHSGAAPSQAHRQ